MNSFSTHANLNPASHWLTQLEVRVKVLHNLGLVRSSENEHDGNTQRATTVSMQTICAEALRTGLWPLSHEGTKPVYISRLLSIARRLAEPALIDYTPSSDKPSKDA